MYRIPDSVDPTQICITWLQRAPEKTASVVDLSIKADFKLQEIDSDDFPLE